MGGWKKQPGFKMWGEGVCAVVRAGVAVCKSPRLAQVCFLCI